jgi:hypothetical protein
MSATPAGPRNLIGAALVLPSVPNVPQRKGPWTTVASSDYPSSPSPALRSCSSLRSRS